MACRHRFKFTLHNTRNPAKTLVLSYPHELVRCICIHAVNPACDAYCVGYDLVDLCTALGLDPNSPVFAAGAPTTRLQVDHDITFVDSIINIPVHRTSPSSTGLHN
jgi:hypothetical protein